MTPARWLVDRTLSRFTGIEPHAVDVAAATLVERTSPGSIEAIVQQHVGRAEALSFAVGATLARSDARALVEFAWNALAPSQRGFATNAFGVLLARIDLEWAWGLAETTVLDTGAGALLAMLAEAGGLDPSLPSIHEANVSALQLLRDAARDPIGASSAVLARRADWRSGPFDAQVFTLAACALVDPIAALDIVVRDDVWLVHGDVIPIVARELRAGGHDAAWLATMPPLDEFHRRAAWLSVAAETGLIAGESGHAVVAETFDEVYRNAAADEEVSECYGLLSAFVCLDRAADLVAGADRVRMPPGMLADLLFWNGNARVAGEVIAAGAFERLLARSRDEWGGGRSGWGPGWWHDALDAGALLETSTSVAALAGHAPWRYPPDSLDTFIETLKASRVD